MSGDDLTVVILREIRDEIRGTNQRLDGTNQRLDALGTDLGSRIEGTNQRLDVVDQRLAVVDQRLESVAAGITKLATQQILTNRYVGNVSNRHDEAIQELRDRVDNLEKSAR